MGRIRRLTSALTLAAAIAAPVLAQQPAPSKPQQQVDIEAQTAQRQVAATTVVPLLRDVRKQAQGGVQMRQGDPPNSPFTGTQTTLFSMSVSKREPAPPEVLKALDRLIEWNPGDRMAEADARLFDDVFDDVSTRMLALGAQVEAGVKCDRACILSRLTKLDETWGPDPRRRAAVRDQMLLDAVTSVVEARK